MADKMIVGLLGNGAVQLRLPDFLRDEQAAAFLLWVRLASQNFFVRLLKQWPGKGRATIQFQAALDGKCLCNNSSRVDLLSFFFALLLCASSWLCNSASKALALAERFQLAGGFAPAKKPCRDAIGRADAFAGVRAAISKMAGGPPR